MTQSATNWIYAFEDRLPEAVSDPVAVLGGKGAGLHTLHQAGLSVPPGFVLTTDCCAEYFSLDGEWPEGLRDQIRAHLRRLEERTGRAYGKGSAPLLVSVRSGAARSMPGMMDTLLNVGLHPGLADSVGDSNAFWDLYVEFILMFACTAADISPSAFDEVTRMRKNGSQRETAVRAIEIYEQLSGCSFPRDPMELLFTCVETVFKSWHNPRAEEYRRRNDIRGLTGTAVTVQVMFPSEVSGILFTRDPTRPDAGHMIIEASWGLGEAVVSGDVSPDRYTVNREHPETYEEVVGDKRHSIRALGDSTPHTPDIPCLNDKQLKELCALGLKAEAQAGSPRDLEWAIRGDELVLLQSRGIRGLDIMLDAENGRQEEISRLRELSREAPRVWVMHNLAETLPLPTPMTWDIVREFMSGRGGFGRMYSALGYQPSPRVQRDGFLESICGRVYADPERLAELFWDGMPLRYNVDEIIKHPEQLSRAPGRFDSDQVEPDFLLKLPRILVGMFRNSRRLRDLPEQSVPRFENEILPPYLSYVREKREQDLKSFSIPALIGELNARCEHVLGEFGGESLLPGFAAGMVLQQAHMKLADLCGDETASGLLNACTMALEGDITAEQDLWITKLAKGEITLAEFMERYGHRGVGEMELMEPRWREDADYIMSLSNHAARNPDADPAARHAKNLQKREEALAALPARLREWGGSSLEEGILRDIERAQRLLPYRENGKYYLMMGYELIRRVLLEFSRRWDLGTGIFFLTRDELGDFEQDKSRYKELIQSRLTRWKAWKQLDPPLVIDSQDLDNLGHHREIQSSSGQLSGEGIASGVGEGIARLVLDPRHAAALGEDEVLVCPSTDPGWTSLFVRAKALVVEKGGSLSHGAIVARDLGIPAVVCPEATRLISEGARIRVDGNHGIIEIMEGNK